jgi:hypothetical protein
MSDQNSQSKNSPQLPDHYLKTDRRYRESQYFLMDQLRYAEAVQEFRSVKQAILRSVEFNVGRRVFQFANVTISSEDF